MYGHCHRDDCDSDQEVGVLGRDTSHRTRLRYLRFINEAHVDIF